MEKISVIGAGAMGRTIALQAALSNFETVVVGLDASELQNCMQAIRETATIFCEEWPAKQADIRKIIASISTDTDLSKAVANSTFVIECVPENLYLKSQLFQKLERHTSADTILASTTSTFTPADLFKNLRVPQRAVITHFWNPAHLIRLVEVVKGENTSDNVFDRTITLLRKMDKYPVVLKKPIPGFIGNRLQLALFREAEYLVSNDICSVEDVDNVVTYGFGRRLGITGPFMSADLTGLDVMKAISEQLYNGLSAAVEPTAAINNLVSKKMLGRKTGRGFYENKGGLYERIHLARTRDLIRRMRDDFTE